MPRNSIRMLTTADRNRKHRPYKDVSTNAPVLIRVLTVDDDETDRMYLAKVLRACRLNAQVEEASSITAAIERLRKEAFDILIVDHLLPDGTSLDLLRQLREESMQVPTIITTGFGSDLLAVELLKTGAYDYIPKDRISTNSLSRAIRNTLRLHQAEKELNQHNLLLQGVARASTRLLTTSSHYEAINEALALLGEATGTERVYVMEYQEAPDKDSARLTQRFEWRRNLDTTVHEKPKLHEIPCYSYGSDGWYPLLRAGKTVSGTVNDCPPALRDYMSAQGACSFLLVPILVDNLFRGIVGFDDNHLDRGWSESESTLLAMMAAGVGGALMGHRAQQALQQSEQRFRMLFEKSPDAIFVENEAGIVLDLNPAACQMHQLPRSRLIGANVLDLVPPDVRQKVADEYAMWFTGERTYFTGTSLIHSNKPLPVEIRATRIEYDGKPAMLFHVRDLSERKRIEEERRQLALRLLDIQEEERKRLSSALHDHLGQLLTLTRLELGSLQVADEESKKNQANALQHLNEALQAIRNMAISLRPPILDDLGLEAAMETLTEEFEEGSKVKTSFKRVGPRVTLSKAVQTCFYRVLQEALTNVAKHSKATQVDVIMQFKPGHASLTISDNGQGLSQKPASACQGIGLLGLQERMTRSGGRLDIHSEAGQGTTLIASVPIEKQPVAGEKHDPIDVG
jgi:PAS domain S-box-containing protein